MKDSFNAKTQQILTQRRKEAETQRKIKISALLCGLRVSALSSGFWLLILALCITPVLAATLLRDDFNGGNSGWSFDPGQGSNIVDFNTGGVLRLQSDGGTEFPLVGRSVYPGMIPYSTGIHPHWILALRFRYTEVATYGTAIALGSDSGFTPTRQPAADPIRDKWQNLLWIYQVRNAGEHIFEIVAFGNTHYSQDTATGADTTWHTLELNVDGPTYTLLLDGIEIGSGNTLPTTPRTLWMGSYVTQPTPGNWSDLEIDWLQTDADVEAPTVAIIPSSTPGNNGWSKAPVQIALEVTDAWASVRDINYRLDGDLWYYHGPFTVAGDGLHTLEYNAVDEAGNVSPVQTLTLAIDTTPPGSAIQSPANNEWVHGIIQVNGTAWDATSGLAAVSYATDGGVLWTPVSGTTAWSTTWDTTSSPDGDTLLSSRAEDRAGNLETPATRLVHIDNTPPHTTAALAGTAGNGAWHRSPVTVTLTATDAGVGVDTTEYRIDGGSWAAYSSPLVVNSDGLHTLSYRSADLLGNQEAEQSLEIRIDTQPPQTTVNLSGPLGHNGWYTGTVLATFTAQDAASGIGDIYLDGLAMLAPTMTFATDGVFNFPYFSVDKAGNRETAHTLKLKLDTLPPSATLMGGAFCPGCGEILVLRTNAWDVGSGLNSWRLEILRARGSGLVQSWEGAGTPPATQSWNGTDLAGRRLPAGSYPVQLTVIDLVGWSRVVTGTVQITEAPVTPTATPTATATPRPTFTPTPQPTAIPQPVAGQEEPTAIATPTATGTPTPTSTPRPSVTPTARPVLQETPVLPTATPQPTITPTQTPMPEPTFQPVLPKELPGKAAKGRKPDWPPVHTGGLWFPLGSAGMLLLTGLATVLDRRSVFVEKLQKALAYEGLDF